MQKKIPTKFKAFYFCHVKDDFVFPEKAM